MNIKQSTLQVVRLSTYLIYINFFLYILKNYKTIITHYKICYLIKNSSLIFIFHFSDKIIFIINYIFLDF